MQHLPSQAALSCAEATWQSSDNLPRHSGDEAMTMLSACNTCNVTTETQR